MHWGTPGTWEILSFPSRTSGWGSRYRKNPGPRLRVPTASEETKTGTGRYCQAKETKRGGMNGRKSEQPILAVKAGNRSEGPVGAKGLPEHGTVGGKDAG